MVYDRIVYYSLDYRVRRAVINRIRDLLYGFEEIVFAVIYGSFLDKQSFRDIDILVHTLQPLPLKRYLEIASIIEEEIGYPIDLIPTHYTIPQVIVNAIRNGILLFDKTGHQVDLVYKRALEEVNSIMLKRRIIP